MMSAAEVRRLLDTGHKITLIAPSAWKPLGEGQLEVKMGDEIRLRRHHEDWLLGCQTSLPQGAQGWCHQDALTIWQVHTPLTPDPSWGSSSSFLPLEVGD